MAVVPTINRNAGSGDGSVIVLSYALTTALPIGEWYEFPEWADCCIQAVGTWGGATCSVEGSNDGTNAFTLSNAAGGTAATFAANGGKTVIERPRYMRPNLTTVGVGATVTVTVVIRRANPMRT